MRITTRRRARTRGATMERGMQAAAVVWIPAGVKHWHGAAPSTAMTHIAVQEVADGRNVEWLEKGSDRQFASPQRTGVLDMPIAPTNCPST